MKKSLIIFLTLIFLFIFIEFLSPYSPARQKEQYTAMPPSRIHFWHEGKWTGPFVYNHKQQPDPLGLFTWGDQYKILGIFPCNLHLFGTKEDTGMIAILGTDAFGRDVFSRLLWGGRLSLLIAACAALLSMLLSFHMGIISAMNSRADKVVQFVAELLKTIPRILLILVLARLIPPTASAGHRALSLIFILSSLGWMYWAKIVRTLAYKAMEKEYILCAWTQGAKSRNIMVMHIWPLLRNYFSTAFMNSLPLMLISEAMLSFLGVGIQEPFVSWGLMLNQLDSASNLMQMPWLVSSAVALMCTVLLVHHWGRFLHTEAPSDA